MKLFRLLVPSVLLLAALGLAAGQAAVSDAALSAGQQFRILLSERVQEYGKKGAAAVPGVDHWLFLLAELRFLSCDTFWGDAAAKVSRSSKPETADPLPAIVDFH